MKRNPAPAHTWINDAACIEDDPSTYDIDTPFTQSLSDKHLNLTYIHDRLQNLQCTTCSVAAQCAADAAFHRDTGVIRGRLPLFPTHGRGVHLRRIIAPVLVRVAIGAPVDKMQKLAIDRLTEAIRT